jgi:hypothetical protein
MRNKRIVHTLSAAAAAAKDLACEHLAEPRPFGECFRAHGTKAVYPGLSIRPT